MNPNASTVSGEQHRQQHQQNQTNIYRSVQLRLGTVTEVHPELPLVRVRFNDDVVAAGGNWIGVGHSVLDIVQRFGRLRKGLRTLVFWSGSAEKQAIALIVGVEDERLGSEIQHSNDFNSTYPWEIFTPGISSAIPGVSSEPGDPVLGSAVLGDTSIKIPGLGKVKI